MRVVVEQDHAFHPRLDDDPGVAKRPRVPLQHPPEPAAEVDPHRDVVPHLVRHGDAAPLERKPGGLDESVDRRLSVGPRVPGAELAGTHGQSGRLRRAEDGGEERRVHLRPAEVVEERDSGEALQPRLAHADPRRDRPDDCGRPTGVVPIVAMNGAAGVVGVGGVVQAEERFPLDHGWHRITGSLLVGSGDTTLERLGEGRVMRFAKMHGAGNDFVVVDARGTELDWSAVARGVSDRHFGVGSDGLILVLPSERADLRMRMFNPDGSESEMCGNGIRCFAKFVLERGLADTGTGALRVETAPGVLTVEPISEGGRIVRARVAMGVPALRPEDVPVDPSRRLTPVGARERAAGGGGGDALVLDWSLEAAGRTLTITGVSMGNPHAVAFIDEPVAGFPLEEVGPAVERHPLFPRRVNFEVANVVDRGRVTARVWERGAGMTLACGSGACAVAVAARLHGATDDRVDITLPGGVLTVTWDGLGEVFLEGPVAEVFEGEWPGS